MIQVTKVIEYLRGKLAPAWNVDGAGALATAKDNSRLMTGAQSEFIPTLFVMLGKFQVTTVTEDPIDQNYDERIVIIACLDNTLDRTGKYAQQLVYHLRLALYGCFLNYRYDLDCHTIKAVGDEMIGELMDRARYWHKFEFSQKGRLQEPDGVGLDLSYLNRLVTDWQSTDPIADEPMAEDDLKNLYFPNPD